MGRMDEADAPGRHAWGAGRLSPDQEARFIEGVEYCGRFFVGMAEAHQALYRLTAILEGEGLPYAIIGAFALNEYGHRRVTVGVDLVMRDEDLRVFKERHLGKGYAERVPGTGKLLDTEDGVHIDVRSTGRFPGDGKPKPIAFPDPRTAAVRGDRFALLPMPRFIELKLASGMVPRTEAKTSSTSKSSSAAQAWGGRSRKTWIPGCARSSSSSGSSPRWSIHFDWTGQGLTGAGEPLILRDGCRRQ
jgi:hypothetical protein